MAILKKCVYCGVREGTTKDHTPPRCFFGGKLPNNAVSVPCCELCRKAGEKNETTIKNLFTSFETTEIHPLVKSTLISKRDRSFAYDNKEAQKLMEMMRDVEVFSPAGILLGTKKGFNLKHPMVDSFVERMCRALLHTEFEQAYFEGEFGWRLNPPIPQPIIDWIKAQLPGRQLSNVFFYRISNPHPSMPTWVNMLFYERVHIMVRVNLHRSLIIQAT